MSIFDNKYLKPDAAIASLMTPSEEQTVQVRAISVIATVSKLTIEAHMENDQYKLEYAAIVLWVLNYLDLFDEDMTTLLCHGTMACADMDKIPRPEAVKALHELQDKANEVKKELDAYYNKHREKVKTLKEETIRGFFKH